MSVTNAWGLTTPDEHPQVPQPCSCYAVVAWCGQNRNANCAAVGRVRCLIGRSEQRCPSSRVSPTCPCEAATFPTPPSRLVSVPLSTSTPHFQRRRPPIVTTRSVPAEHHVGDQPLGPLTSLPSPPRVSSRDPRTRASAHLISLYLNHALQHITMACNQGAGPVAALRV